LGKNKQKIAARAAAIPLIALMSPPT